MMFHVILFAPSMGAPEGDLIWECVFMFKTDRIFRTWTH
jgi:hypothetical protein